LDKIKRIRGMLDELNIDTPIALDGGIDTQTAPLVVGAGATVLVAGSSVYNSRDSVVNNINALLKSVQCHM
jgi:ribulose-phosphate 3-epimerase